MKFNKISYIRYLSVRFVTITFLGMLLSVSGIAQENVSSADSLRKDALNFFLDCNTCDMNYIREEIPYVNFVRDTREAEVYLLVTDQSAGSGGMQYTFTFEGQGRYEGMNDTLIYTSNPDETSSMIREKKNNFIEMGLMRYVARTPLSSEIEIRNNIGYEQEEVIDRWNNWVFEIQTSPRFNAEESYNRIQFSNSLNITKITPNIKVEIQLDQNNTKQRYIVGDITTEYVRSSKSMDILLVKSISNHWSAGLKWDVRASTSNNYDFNTDFLPSIEYDIFPYTESTHRQFRFLYSVGYQYNDYIDTTILNQTREGLFKQELAIAYQVQEKWGSINVSLTGLNYFHDFSKNSISLDGFIQLRIIKGLSLMLNGGVGYVNDQVNLRKGDLTEAERLLRLKEQATSFDVQGGLTISYTFGSIYNNVVNPRFGSRRGMGGGGGGGGMRFF